MNTLLPSAAVLASDLELDSDTVTPGVLGFLVVFAIGVGLYFLMRSLMGKLRALPKDDDFTAGADASARGSSAAEASSEDASAEDTTPRT
ncbi:hypothetical protein [Nocardiopsis quinghaiensis]|uniref:hypothetical protein n=1 Tax=Nocardiopsis quinghaiensis TaxID=464995 RepID=UPI0012390455|nr:hypothetical protein [Nocardiopsis quinghaiensis]